MAVALQYIVDNLDVPFVYMSLVRNHSAEANSYLNTIYNIWGVPSCYTDGGVQTAIGAVSWQTLFDQVTVAGSRPVPGFGLGLELNHVESTLYEIKIHIKYGNQRPGAPDEIAGPEFGLIGHDYAFSVAAGDPDGGEVWYNFDWGDGTSSGWTGPYNSGDSAHLTNFWIDIGSYDIIVRTRDNWHFESDSIVKTISVDNYFYGDANADQMVNILDISYLIDFLYYNGPAPQPYDAGDVDNNVVVNILDISYLIDYLYYNGPPPH